MLFLEQRSGLRAVESMTFYIVLASLVIMVVALLIEIVYAVKAKI